MMLAATHPDNRPADLGIPIATLMYVISTLMDADGGSLSGPHVLRGLIFFCVIHSMQVQ